ncbi:hypothetical protein ACFL51_00635 [Myxococcota bacterium]
MARKPKYDGKPKWKPHTTECKVRSFPGDEPVQTVQVTSDFDTSGIGPRMRFLNPDGEPVTIELLPDPSDLRRWLDEATPGTELTAAIYGDEPRAPGSGLLSDIEKAYACAIECLEEHKHTRDATGEWDLQPDCFRCRIAVKILRSIDDSLRLARDGKLGLAGAQLLWIGAFWVRLDDLKMNRFAQVGKRQSAGGKKSGEQRTAERDALDAELFPDGPDADEPIVEQAWKRMHDEGANDEDKRYRRAEDAARRKRGTLPNRSCDVCGVSYPPKSERSRRCPRCVNLNQDQAKVRRQKHLGK